MPIRRAALILPAISTFSANRGFALASPALPPTAGRLEGIGMLGHLFASRWVVLLAGRWQRSRRFSQARKFRRAPGKSWHAGTQRAAPPEARHAADGLGWPRRCAYDQGVRRPEGDLQGRFSLDRFAALVISPCQTSSLIMPSAGGSDGKRGPSKERGRQLRSCDLTPSRKR